MAYKIVDKKRFVIFVVTATFLLAAIFVGGIYAFIKVKDRRTHTSQNQTQIETIQDSIKTQVDSSPDNDVAKEDTEDNTQAVAIYENQSYHYAVTFPDGWFINNDYSESKIAEADNGSGIKMLEGGQTFWSNYENINQYDAQNKPNDFHLLGLTVYKDASQNIDEFAQKIGAKDFTAANEIQAANISGTQYVGEGLTEKNPRITAIFKKDEFFYVFKPAFINGDENAADIMQSIVKSFTLK